jgi:hypothetical protein
LACAVSEQEAQEGASGEEPDPLLYERPQAPAPEEPSRLDTAIETTGKVAVGCLSCVTLVAAAVGTLLGLGAGGLYHAFLAPEGNVWLHLALGALVGFLAGARTVLPVEELLFDWVEERILGGHEGPRKRGRGRG